MCIGTVSWPLMYAAPIMASAAEPITFDMIREMEWIELLRRGRVVSGFTCQGACLPGNNSH